MENKQIAASPKIERGQIWRTEDNRFYRVVAVTKPDTVFVRPAHLKCTAPMEVLRAWFSAKPEDGGWVLSRD